MADDCHTACCSVTPAHQSNSHLIYPLNGPSSRLCSHHCTQSFKPQQVFLTVLPFLLCINSDVIIDPGVLFSAGKTLSEPIKAADMRALEKRDHCCLVRSFAPSVRKHPMPAGKSGRHAMHPNVFCVPKNIQHLFEFSPAFMFVPPCFHGITQRDTVIKCRVA